MTYGMKQKTLRTARNMTQEGLARAAETTQERISDFEVGRRSPGEVEEALIRKALDWTEEVEAQLLALGGANA